MIHLQPNPKNHLFIYPTASAAIEAAASGWVQRANECIKKRGAFHVALSGGSTPKAIYALLANSYAHALDWGAVHLYWSDERFVPHDSAESNYLMAMQSGFVGLPIPEDQIHAVPTHLEVDECAEEYNKLLMRSELDLVMLGMGNDGHTASLFPCTTALSIDDRYFVANRMVDGKSWRLTMTYPGIWSGRQCVIYALGQDKSERLESVLLGHFDIEKQPIQGVGRVGFAAHWILDEAAATGYLHRMKEEQDGQDPASPGGWAG